MTRILSKFNRFFQQRAAGRNVLILFVLTAGSLWLMAGVITPAFQEVTDGLRPFDLNFGVTAEMVYRDLPFYTNRSKTLYIWFAIVDYIYPAVGAAFFAMLWAWMFKKAPNRFFHRLVASGIFVFPFLFALVDWLENAGFLFVIFSYPSEFPAIANTAGALKKTKPFIELAIVLLTIVFAVVAIWKFRRQSH